MAVAGGRVPPGVPVPFLAGCESPRELGGGAGPGAEPVLMRVGLRLLLLAGSRCYPGPGAVPAPVRVGIPVLLGIGVPVPVPAPPVR